MSDDREPNASGANEGAAGESVGIRLRQVGLGTPNADRLRARLARTAHRRFRPAVPPHPGWTSFSTQRHVRDVAVGRDDLRVWLATWGGALCWTPSDGRVERHGSEHGLVGNSARSVAVDRAGIVWVGQDGGLCSLDLDASGGWRQHPDLLGWTITHVRARPAGGVFVAVRDPRGGCAIAEIATPEAAPRIRLRSQMACDDVTAVVPADDGTLWLGNAWGVFHDTGAASPIHYDLSIDAEGKRAVQQQVRSLAIADSNTLWVGTDWGLYRLYATQRKHEPVSAVRGAIRSLATDPIRGRILVVTDDAVGTWDGIEWVPTSTAALGLQHVVACASIEGATRTWVGGAEGLHEFGAAGLDDTFPPSAEDTVANGVNAISASESDTWIGTTRGIFRYGDEWRPVEGDSAETGERTPVRWDVRALASEPTQHVMWAATWDQGLRSFVEGFYIPGADSDMPVVAVTAAADGAMWFATPDAIYQALAGEIHAQRRLTLPDDAGVIRTLCHQVAMRSGGAAAPMLWIGTTTGLLACRPDLQLWDDAPAELRGVPVNALAIDPRDGSLWVGTRDGLFSEHRWARHTKEDVQAIAFGAAPDESLWIGTSSGLEQRRVPTSQAGATPTLVGRWTAATSGLAADAVTALCVRSIDGQCELWAGSRSGVSRFRYESLRT
jgi:ligand-binding sensor domain-containing protein